MATDNFCFYLQNRLIQTSQTTGQRYSDTSSIVLPVHGFKAYACSNICIELVDEKEMSFAQNHEVLQIAQKCKWILRVTIRYIYNSVNSHMLMVFRFTENIFIHKNPYHN